jgi:glycosyltransferase involved in cell wall biosynthesis
MRVAIIHDYLNQYGGAERVLGAFHEIFPDAPIFTIVYDKKILPQYKRWDIRTSFVQKIPFAKQRYRNFVFLFPKAVRSFDLDKFDLIISNTHAWGKGINIDGRAPHICYCLTPMRYIWDLYRDYLIHEYINPVARYMLPILAKRLRRWDIKTSKNVKHYIAISQTVAKRIKDFYNREAVIIYPPCDTSFFRPNNNGSMDYYLTVSRLKAYKRIDILIEAFNRLNLPLKIIGIGPELKRLKQKAGKTIEFLDWVSDKDLLYYYQNCKAFVFAGYEDFGLTLVEAQACGSPVIAYGRGGAEEIVIEEKTGLFFHEPTSQALIQAIEKFQNIKFDKDQIRENALRFDKAIFKNNLLSFINGKIKIGE